MKPTLLLRIASILTLLFALGHTAGGLSSWSPAGETEVLRAMKSFRFDAGGLNRSYLDFYLGFGLVISVYLFSQAIAFWQLASLSKSDASRVRPIVGTFFLTSSVCAIVSWMFILLVPVAFFAGIATCLALAFYAARSNQDA